MTKLATFNTNSLSAVSDYFGPVDDKNSDDEGTRDPEKNGRGGVGSLIARKQKSTIPLLNIGKSEQHGEEDITDAISDEEEDGRTAITADTQTREINHDEIFNVKKKKKDKKRRRKEASNKAKKDPTSTSPDELEATAKEEEAKAGSAPISFHKSNQNVNEEAPKKRQRVKKRSRQKNIRKDTRPLEARPAHLQLGNRNYKGRPLTEETRAKLNIPKRTKVKKHSKSRFEDFTNTKLAIDDLVDDSNNIVNEPTFEKSIMSTLDVAKDKRGKASSKKRKAKYKNLI